MKDGRCCFEGVECFACLINEIGVNKDRKKKDKKMKKSKEKRKGKFDFRTHDVTLSARS